ncbi:MAG: hypothetical protein A3K09_01580 [Nitrospinae bacterium RIFCSPLOWO2_12_FULL_47_7]|nr:MAG: hypothetical protein A3K09_01580 [Nitrospinae bacterium RIFCSPLOWO2_12_FULL_47_7]
MTRSDLVAKLSFRLGITKANADKYVLAFLDAISVSLETDGKAVMQGFGSFRLKEYQARTAKKPITGETFKLPARRKPVFHAGKELREMVNSKSKTVWGGKQTQRPIALYL